MLTKKSQIQKMCSLLLLLGLSLQSGYTFNDPTGKSTSNLNGYGRSKKRVPRHNGGGGGGGLPVSKFGAAKPQANGSYGNFSGASPQAQSAVGGSGNNSNTMNQIMGLLQTQPQLMNNFKSTMSNGNSQQKGQLLQTLMQLLGGNGGGNAGAAMASPQAAAAADGPAHCSAPKYNSIMNAVKGINLSKEKALQHGATGKILFVYYKKTEEANFVGYKLVFKFEDGPKRDYVYADFTIPKLSGSALKFQNYLVTSNPGLLKNIVNETDFSANNQIECMDMRIMFNGGVAGQKTSSAFGNAPASNMGGGMMRGNNMIGQGMMGGNNMMGQGMMGGNNMMGQSMMGQGMMGQGMMGQGMMNQGMMGQGMMMQNRQGMGGGFGFNANQGNSNGTFITK